MNQLTWEINSELDNGVVLTFAKAVRMNVDLASGIADVTVEEYVLEGKPPYRSKVVSVDFSDLDPNGTLALAVVDKVKAAAYV